MRTQSTQLATGGMPPDDALVRTRLTEAGRVLIEVHADVKRSALLKLEEARTLRDLLSEYIEILEQ